MPNTNSACVRLELPDITLAGLDRLAMQLTPMLRKGDFLALIGDLGSGKTAFARALILRLMGPDRVEEVPSPSFALLQTYQATRLPVHHFDFYRLIAPEDALELGLEEALDNGLVLAEWPQKLGDLMPADRLEIHFLETDADDLRHLHLIACGRFAPRLTRLIDINRFLFDAHWDTAWRQHLQGDASTRSYIRLMKIDARALLMDAPRQPDGPPIRDGRPYSALAHLAEDVRPFVAIASYLHDAGFSAPEIYAHDLDKGLLLIEDFGDRGFGQLIADGYDLKHLYQAATRTAVALHYERPPAELPLPDGSSYRLPHYDREALGIELELLADWFIPALTGQAADAAVKAEYLDLWQQALAPVLAASHHLVLRDYHSPNLLWLAERPTEYQRVGLIDFQDAQLGHAAYDLVSLLQDARLTVPPEIEQELLEQYCRTSCHADGFSEAEFRAAYATLGAQRNSKILGIFVRLAKRDNKPQYLAHMPRVAQYLTRDLEHPALAGLKAWYDKHIPIERRANPLAG
jgi:tRNA threonylcarbamoyl adenosine modification protein YjeE